MRGMVATRWKRAVYWFALGVLFTGALTAWGLFTLWNRGEESRAEDRPRNALCSRSDFSDRVLGKTTAEVLETAGKPDQTSEDSEAQYWHYHQRTIDPATNKADSDVQLVIQDGKVIALNY